MEVSGVRRKNWKENPHIFMAFSYFSLFHNKAIHTSLWKRFLHILSKSKDFLPLLNFLSRTLKTAAFLRFALLKIISRRARLFFSFFALEIFYAGRNFSFNATIFALEILQDRFFSLNPFFLMLMKKIWTSIFNFSLC